MWVDVPAPLQVEFQQSSLYAWMVPQIQLMDECFNFFFLCGVYSQCKLCITVEIPQVLFLDWCRVVTVMITVKVPQLQYFDQVDDVFVVYVVVGVSSSWTWLLTCPFLCMSCSSAENCEGFTVAVISTWMMSLLCRYIWVVQSLDKVVDMPVIVNDSDCKQWKCLKFHRRQRQWQLLLVLLVMHFALRSRRLPAGADTQQGR